MSWRDRATRVEGSQPASGGWRARATRVNAPPPVAQTPQSDSMEPSWADVPGKFISGAIDAGKGIIDLGGKVAKMATGTGSPEDAMSLIHTAYESVPHPTYKEGKIGLEPGAIFQPYVNIGKSMYKEGPIQGPVNTFKREPFQTTAALLPFVPKALRMASEAPIIGPAMRTLKGAGTGLGTKVGSYLGDIPEESVSAAIENPKMLSKGPKIHELAETEVPATLTKFDDVVKDLSGRARKLLSTSRYLEEGAITKDEVFKAVDSARKDLGGVYTPEAEAASRVLKKIGGNLKKIRETVSQNQVHDLIKDIDQEIPWDKVWKAPETLTLADKAMIGMRTGLDKILKTKNPAYAEQMKPVSEAIQTRTGFQRNLGVEKIRGQGYQPSNSTVPRLFGATNEDRLATQRILNKTKDITGKDLAPQVKGAQVRADFEPETGRSFRGTDIGLREKFGRPIVKAAIQSIPPVSQGIKSIFSNAPVTLVLTRDKAREFIQQANGDLQKAQELARKAGYSWTLQR